MLEKTTITQTASHWGVYGVETNAHGDILNTFPFEADREPPTLIRGLQSMVRSSLRISQPHIREGYLRNPERPDPTIEAANHSFPLAGTRHWASSLPNYSAYERISVTRPFTGDPTVGPVLGVFTTHQASSNDFSA